MGDGSLTRRWIEDLTAAITWSSRNLPPSDLPSALPVEVVQLLDTEGFPCTTCLPTVHPSLASIQISVKSRRFSLYDIPFDRASFLSLYPNLYKVEIEFMHAK
ncbi:Serine/threonine-protein phosphatase 7 [Apostasia shenzhenica]|uniref:Serine/threonine-protein phosphatase 7 n=1 Tax=Apostasia shenzhenica TaxID=1088818 RepID=A0A2I0B048_9ASPA|nr:Serine/threonine-protein phosphatase 7 [Apostasia shenzhenica]